MKKNLKTKMENKKFLAQLKSYSKKGGIRLFTFNSIKNVDGNVFLSPHLTSDFKNPAGIPDHDHFMGTCSHDEFVRIIATVDRKSVISAPVFDEKNPKIIKYFILAYVYSVNRRSPIRLDFSGGYIVYKHKAKKKENIVNVYDFCSNVEPSDNMEYTVLKAKGVDFAEILIEHTL